jgi:hypothetical protein
MRDREAQQETLQPEANVVLHRHAVEEANDSTRMRDDEEQEAVSATTVVIEAGRGRLLRRR